MKIKLNTLPTAALLLGIALAANVSAQAPGGAAAMPNAKYAIVDIAAFRTEIGELRQKYEKLQAEFAPKARDIEAMQASLEAKQKALNDGGAQMTAVQVRKLQGDIEQLKKDGERAVEDSQALAQKREAEETGATYDKISKFMDQYCAKHAITIVLEAGQLRQTGMVIYAAPTANVTEDFIKAYNAANPVAAAAANPPVAAPKAAAKPNK